MDHGGTTLRNTTRIDGSGSHTMSRYGNWPNLIPKQAHKKRIVKSHIRRPQFIPQPTRDLTMINESIKKYDVKLKTILASKFSLTPHVHIRRSLNLLLLLLIEAQKETSIL